jgi:hypothetical protein
MYEKKEGENYLTACAQETLLDDPCARLKQILASCMCNIVTKSTCIGDPADGGGCSLPAS